MLFALWCARRGLLRASELTRLAAWGVASIVGRIAEPQVADAKRLMLRFGARIGEDRFAALFDECFRALVVPRLRRDLRRELETRKDAGDVLLVTANLRAMAVRMGEHLGIPPQHCLGAEGARRDGGLTGELAGPVPMGETRRRIVRELLADARVARESASAYGDSIHDAPMLEEVGDPVAVHPSRALRSLARAKGWRILG